MPAYYRATIASFLRSDSDAILGQLTAGAASDGYSVQQHAQTDAWREELALLRAQLARLAERLAPSRQWSLLLEYPLLRLQKRIDAVILGCDVVIVMEFKSGARTHDPASIRQVEDYALDLRDFHAVSEGHKIVPVLCATDGPCSQSAASTVVAGEAVQPTQTANASDLAERILDAYEAHHDPLSAALDGHEWDFSAYRPVPTIIQAAELLYAGHTVTEIARHDADVRNLAETSRRIVQLIQQAQAEQRHIVCFVTGVPGSGKTLTGLNAVHDPALRRDHRPSGTLLSGNKPLVDVVREALAQDHARRRRTPVGRARREVRAFIQLLPAFLDHYLKQETQSAPHEHVVVFDEAQRAWDAEHGQRKFGRPASEPELLLRIMERHRDWAVIVALVGGGQEINTGEAGLQEWGDVLVGATQRHAAWAVHASPEAISGGPAVAGSVLFEGGVPGRLTVHEESSLHLPVSIRSFRSEAVAAWVNAVVDGDLARAASVMENARRFPIVVTRSLATARSWLRSKSRGTRRYGLAASSGARRLRAYGLDVSKTLRQTDEICHWFLKLPEDVRSSYAMEVPATEFACQGLELDFVGVCWGFDFTWDEEAGNWRLMQFRGTKWQHVKDPQRREFIRNKYRVLLTRAREGMVLWLPRGDPEDATRPSSRMDAVFGFLTKGGAKVLP